MYTSPTTSGRKGQELPMYVVRSRDACYPQQTSVTIAIEESVHQGQQHFPGCFDIFLVKCNAAFWTQGIDLSQLKFLWMKQKFGSSRCHWVTATDCHLAFWWVVKWWEKNCHQDENVNIPRLAEALTVSWWTFLWEQVIKLHASNRTDGNTNRVWSTAVQCFVIFA